MNELLLGLVRGYNTVTVHETAGENRESQWFKIAKDIEKKLFKFTISKQNRTPNTLDKFNKVKELDNNYFENIDFSAFVMSILLLDYLKREGRDTITRNKFAHINTASIVDELETTKEFKAIARTHHRFVTKIIETLGL